MTPEERADAISQLGLREPIGMANLRIAGSIATVLVSLVVLGAFFLVFGDTTGERVRALVMFLVGVPLAWWAWRWVIRPVAPEDDGDLARELRHRQTTT